jgi:hypothetical protein
LKGLYRELGVLLCTPLAVQRQVPAAVTHLGDVVERKGDALRPIRAAHLLCQHIQQGTHGGIQDLGSLGDLLHRDQLLQRLVSICQDARQLLAAGANRV